MKIPEYYRQFQTDTKKEEDKSPKENFQNKSVQLSEKPQQKKVDDKTKIFQGNGFTLNQLEDWEDKTLYTLLGPVTDGIQHNVIIDTERDVPFETLEEYAEWHIKTLENELKSCTLLKRGEIKLTNGTDAYEAIFSWYPSDEIRIYQQQIFVLVEKTAFKMTASFTKKTRQTIGPAVERMMLSFNPTDSKKK